MTTLTIHMPDNIAAEVERRARATNRSAAEVVDACIADHFGDVLPDDFADDEPHVLRTAEQRFADGPIGRRNAEVFERLEHRISAQS